MVKSVYKAVYMYKSVFMFLVREMNSWPLMLILWYAGRRREEPPPSSLYGTLLCRRGEHKQRGGSESSASRQKHFLRCTSCGWSQRSASWSHCSTFFLPTSPIYFLTSFLPFRAGDVAPSSLLRCHWPAAPTVSSVPCGYCRDVTSSWQHHWASPSSPMGSVTGLQRWGVGGVSHGRAARRFRAKPPRSAPLHAPAEVNDWGLLWENGAEVANFTHLPDSEPKPLCHSAPTDELSDQRGNKVHTTTKDARFHLTRITHQRPCNKLNYNRIIPLYYISRCITKTQAWGI